MWVRKIIIRQKKLFEKACSLDIGHGCGLLGFMYYSGSGVKKDKQQAKFFAGKACDLGVQEACEIYSTMD